MAQFDIHGIDEFARKLERMGRLDEIAPKMLEDGMQVLKPAVVEEAEKHKVTGDMAASIKQTGATYGAGGYYICARPTGKDRNGVRNMEKMAWLEYGVKGRPATPVITRAVLNSEAGVIGAMRRRFEKEVQDG